MKEINIGTTTAQIMLSLAPGIALCVRIGFMMFSSRIRAEVKRHPVLHSLWVVVAMVAFLEGLRIIAVTPE